VLYQLLTGLLPTEDRRRKTKCVLVLQLFVVAPNLHLPALMQARCRQTLYCLVFLINVMATIEQAVACLTKSDAARGLWLPQGAGGLPAGDPGFAVPVPGPQPGGPPHSRGGTPLSHPTCYVKCDSR
jgi:hypothetical protein